jgi:hypothetical protein
MDEPRRTDRARPDAHLLQRIGQQPPDSNRGRLKVFLGAASGVGPTQERLPKVSRSPSATKRREVTSTGGEVTLFVAAPNPTL